MRANFPEQHGSDNNDGTNKKNNDFFLWRAKSRVRGSSRLCSRSARFRAYYIGLPHAAAKIFAYQTKPSSYDAACAVRTTSCGNTIARRRYLYTYCYDTNVFWSCSESRVWRRPFPHEITGNRLKKNNIF